ncbi:MAG: GNAT family N-acetyltransferase, partial [Candidatus Obscuribacterales bacterium]|nr:GNAT family N-acetyltransferase [Candidatus Obscuribacterales bacterium]
MTAIIAEKSSGRWPQLSISSGKVEDITVRQASTTDAAQIAAINIRAWQRAYEGILPEALLNSLSISGAAQAWRQMLIDERAVAWVIEIGGAVKGFASLGKSMDKDASSSTAEIFTIYMEPEYANMGLGRTLLQTMIEDLRKS